MMLKELKKSEREEVANPRSKMNKTQEDVFNTLIALEKLKPKILHEVYEDMVMAAFEKLGITRKETK